MSPIHIAVHIVGYSKLSLLNILLFSIVLVSGDVCARQEHQALVPFMLFYVSGVISADLDGE